MIFCYAWTNLLIINMVNVKLNFYKNEKADLIIKSSKSIDENIVSLIEKSHIFENVFYDEYTSFRPKKKKKHFFEYRKKYADFYERFVLSIGAVEKYDKVLIAGFWNDGLYMMNALWKHGNKFDIEFVEEGEMSYEEEKRLFRAFLGSNKTQRIFQFLNTFWIRKRFKRAFSKCIYLYSPERKETTKWTLMKIPAINENNEIMNIIRNLYEGLPDSQKIVYKKHDVIFIANSLDIAKYENSYNYAYGHIDTILDAIGSRNVLIKAHGSVTDSREKFALEYEKEIFVDREVYIFECLFCNECMEDKILIGKNSALLMHPASMFGQEPYIILLYKLYPWYRNYGDEIVDEYVDSLRTVYKHPERIIVPRSVLEFKLRLKEIYGELESRKINDR